VKHDTNIVRGNRTPHMCVLDTTEGRDAPANSSDGFARPRARGAAPTDPPWNPDRDCDTRRLPGGGIARFDGRRAGGISHGPDCFVFCEAERALEVVDDLYVGVVRGQEALHDGAQVSVHG
jgi:hypothetical protein